MRFDPFLEPQDTTPAETDLGDKIALLDSIGDKKLREAQDFLWSIGVDAPLVTGEWRPAPDQIVSYGLPDGSRRVGTHVRMEGRDALVRTADGSALVAVPLEHVSPASSDAEVAFHRQRLASAFEPRSLLRETRAAIDMGNGLWSLALAYPLGRKPPIDEVQAWVKAAYKDVEIVDGDDQIPGKIALVVHRRHPEAELIDEKKIAEDELEKCAKANPSFEFVAGAYEPSESGGVLHFSVRHAGAPVFVRQGSWTKMIASDAQPCTGCVFVDDGVASVRVAAYESGHGPFSMHFDDPRGRTPEDGSYAVQAEADKDAAPPPMSTLTKRDFERQKTDFDDRHRTDEEKAKERRKMLQRDRERQQTLQPAPGPGEHIESIGGPGLHMAVDESAKDYWTTYFGEYGRTFTEDKVAMIRYAWRDAGKGEPTALDVGWVLSVTKHIETLAKRAQKSPAEVGYERGQHRRDILQQRQAVDPVPAPATAEVPPKPPAQPGKPTLQVSDLTGAANALIQAMGMSDGARTAVEGLITQFMARMPEAQRRSMNPEDPGTIQRLLPAALKSMKPKQIEGLIYQYAPQVQLVDAQGQPMGGGLRGLTRKLPWSQQKKTRQQMEHGQWTQQLMEGYQPPGAAPRPAAQPTTPAVAPTAPEAQPTTPQAQPATPATPSSGQAVPEAKPPGNFMRVKMPPGAKGINPGGAEIDLSNQEVLVKAGERESEGMKGPLAQGERRFFVDSLWREGRYAKARISWDPASLQGLNPGAVIQAVKSFVLAASTWKDRFDMGFISRPIVCHFDHEIGLAEVRFRSSNIEGFVPAVKELE